MVRPVGSPLGVSSDGEKDQIPIAEGIRPSRSEDLELGLLQGTGGASEPSGSVEGGTCASEEGEMIVPVMWDREAPRDMRGVPFLMRYQVRRRRDRADQARAASLARGFVAGASGVGLTRDTESCAGIGGMAVPRVHHVCLGRRSDRLTVQMLPGQMVGEYQDHAAELAESLGAEHLRIRRVRHGVLSIEVLYEHPLDEQVSPTAGPDLVFGSLDSGELLSYGLDSLAHVICQGQTRSGKSRFCYGLLVQLVERSDVLICGSDVTDLLLRPFEGTRHEDLQARGSTNVGEHLAVLQHLVSVMDERITKIPDDRDVFECTDADPYLFVVLEELPGLLRLAAQEDGKKNGPLQTAIKAAFGRLLAEGAKAGVRLLALTQRADADIIGGFERGQAPLRISFSVDSRDAVRMLHPAAPLDVADAHLSAPPSYALVSAPGLACGRLRSPYMGDYRSYRDAIARHRSEPDLF